MVNVKLNTGDDNVFSLTFQDELNQPIQLSEFDNMFLDISASPIVPTETVKMKIGSGLEVSGSTLIVSVDNSNSSKLIQSKYYGDLKTLKGTKVSTLLRVEFDVDFTVTKVIDFTTGSGVTVTPPDVWEYAIDLTLTGNDLEGRAFNTILPGQFVIYGLTGTFDNTLAGLQYIEISSVSNNGTSYIPYFTENEVVSGIGASVPYGGDITFIDTSGSSMVYNVVGQYQSAEDRAQFDISYHSGSAVINSGDVVEVQFNLIRP